MVEIIAGEKGKGKTKYLLDMVNSAVAHATGNIVYLDKSQKHMHELTNRVRLINVTEYPITNMDEFIGFICGIVSQDYDLQEMYLDSFLTIANLNDDQMVHVIEKLNVISEKYAVRIVLSVSRNEADLPEPVKARVLISL
ncbi:MAG: twitching motility protein PilT [Lachnospiraceae bacterium]|nr:twitching motility protein PilT [Lachnospiraceae bacterium]MCC8101780.1 twitching motility protein PilT [Clostridiales bacterium]